jgi:hypothetical protein
MTTPAPTFVSSHATTFSFSGTTYKCVDISFESSAPSRDRVDMSTLDQADGSTMTMMDSPLKPAADPDKFTITYKYTGTKPAAGTQATLTTADGSGTFFCTASSLSRKSNSYVEGTATFEKVTT